MQDSHPQTFDQQLQTLQIIIVALAMGCLLFAGVATFVGPDATNETIIAKAALAAGLAALVINGPVGRVLRSQPCEPEQRMQIYTTSTIVSAAILEGAIFFNLINYLTDRSYWCLAMAGLLWVALLMKFPTRGSVESWLEKQDRRQRDEAALDPNR